MTSQKNGPASDSQHPLWIPDSGGLHLKQKVNILCLNDKSTRNGSNGRKAQRLESRRGTESKVLGLTAGEEANNGLLRESIRNSSVIVTPQ